MRYSASSIDVLKFSSPGKIGVYQAPMLRQERGAGRGSEEHLTPDGSIVGHILGTVASTVTQTIVDSNRP